MTREEALNTLKLSPSATDEEIDGAYKRLVKRYPPEFQPEKFRQIDEAYRFLTSLPYLLGRLLSPDIEKATIDPELFTFSPSPPSSFLEEALEDIKRDLRMSYLWPSSND